MKKLIFMLAVLLLATPAMATVTLSMAVTGPNEVTVSFVATGEPNLVRAIALDVIVDDPNVVIADVNCVNGDYGIYPGSISIDAGGTVTDWGTCAGDATGSNTVPTEQGSLYEDGDPTPSQSGDLFIITLENCTAPGNSSVAVSLTEDALRGGIVLEDPTVEPTVAAMPSINVTIAECTVPVVGCPTCLGDMNGDGWLSPTDLTLLFNQLSVLPSPYWTPSSGPADCGDMNGDTWISPTDLTLLFNQLSVLPSPYWTACP